MTVERKRIHLLVSVSLAVAADRVVAVAGGELAACGTPPTALDTEPAVATKICQRETISEYILF